MNRPPARTALSAPRLASLLLATLFTVATPPLQAQPAATDTPACTQDLPPARLYGFWELHLWPADGSPDQPVSTGAVLFEPHPEYPGSVRGSLSRSAPGNDRKAFVSGDVEDGEFNLDESADGVTMDAVWVGAPRDCGRELAGDRLPAEGRAASEPVLRFLLRRRPGW
ncbi:hypothetical protein [Hydrogenophaga sp. NFH-34]|uniref:hypothetical protein n=1 Tax=Hydrogenophaga sp. NFH-34 TaxID=2744446 RepID=UPI001F2D6F5B|nr:hypothetical protein [Hydrogenophaga sp. NFH-34]